MAQERLDSLLSFVEFTHLVQGVERVVYVNGEKRWENDAEHSFQTAMVAWYIIEAGKLNLDLGKVLRFSLAHDLVEAYAGDTFIYGKEEHLASKQKREEKAAKKIAKKFPEFSSLHKLIQEYEARESAEAKFVYALDKLLPIINIYLDKGRTWKKESITLEKLMKVKTEKIALSPEVMLFYEEILVILKNNPQLFNS